VLVAKLQLQPFQSYLPLAPIPSILVSFLEPISKLRAGEQPKQGTRARPAKVKPLRATLARRALLRLDGAVTFATITGPDGLVAACEELQRRGFDDDQAANSARRCSAPQSMTVGGGKD